MTILKAVHQLETCSSSSNSKAANLLSSIEEVQRTQANRLEDVSMSMHQLSELLIGLKTESTRARKNQRMLRSLCCKTMKVRESRVAKAHTKTFEWILDKGAPRDVSTDFQDWLKRGHGVFWAMGKVGSGKSTLMKFLGHHRRTKELLSEWAGASRCISASYFFWNAGTRMQKSQEGLLQTLLFEVLRQCPAAIPNILSEGPTHDGTEEEIEPWSMDQLLDCFSKLKMYAQHTTKFCFFIDGLDEYEGECSDLVKALQALSTSPMIKICASSRPWFVFRDAFGHDPRKMLKLEDLTRADIAAYANDMLSSHPRFPMLQARDNRYPNLIKEITDRARGVFLWVFLVTTSLRRGLTNADSISVLQERMSKLPDSLEDFFRHILGTVEDVYESHTAKLFRCALNPPASGPIPLIVFSYLDEEDPDFALRLECRDPSADEIEIRYDEARRRLDGRTRGLLEASDSASYTEVPTVDFLHRTVRDYFLAKDMQNMMQASLDPEFNADVELCKAFLAQMKWGPWSNAEDCLKSVMFYVHEVEHKFGLPLPEILDETEKIVCTPSAWNISNFENFLINQNLLHNLAYRLDKIPIAKGNRPLLDVALSPRASRAHRSSRSMGKQYLSPETISLLLSKGADPNEITNDRLSVWAAFLLRMYHESPVRVPTSSISSHWQDDTSDRKTRVSRDVLRQTTELLLLNGANPEELVPLDKNADRVLSASQLIKLILPDDADALLQQVGSADSIVVDDAVAQITTDDTIQPIDVGWTSWIRNKIFVRT
jgi:hypothetical protein